MVTTTDGFQSRGALFGINPQTERFVFGSPNVGEVLGIGTASSLVGKPFYAVLGREVSHALRNAETHQSLKRRRRNLGILGLSHRQFEFEVFLSKGVLVVEATPHTGGASPSVYDVFGDVDVLTDALLEPVSETQPFKRFISLLKTMSGYHTVALDRLDGACCETVSVAGLPELAECPAPFAKQFCSVLDIAAPSMEVELPTGWTLDDLALSGLLHPNALDKAALTAAGVASCASIGLWRGEELWGRIKFLHLQPRLPNKRTQLALSHLTPLISMRLLNAY